MKKNTSDVWLNATIIAVLLLLFFGLLHNPAKSATVFRDGSGMADTMDEYCGDWDTLLRATGEKGERPFLQYQHGGSLVTQFYNPKTGTFSNAIQTDKTRNGKTQWCVLVWGVEMKPIRGEPKVLKNGTTGL